MGVKLTMFPKPFSQLLVALSAGEVDMVMSNVSITPQRTLKAPFVKGHVNNDRRLRRSNPDANLLTLAAPINIEPIGIAVFAQEMAGR